MKERAKQAAERELTRQAERALMRIATGERQGRIAIIEALKDTGLRMSKIMTLPAEKRVKYLLAHAKRQPRDSIDVMLDKLFVGLLD